MMSPLPWSAGAASLLWWAWGVVGGAIAGGLAGARARSAEPAPAPPAPPAPPPPPLAPAPEPEPEPARRPSDWERFAARMDLVTFPHALHILLSECPEHERRELHDALYPTWCLTSRLRPFVGGPLC